MRISTFLSEMLLNLGEEERMFKIPHLSLVASHLCLIEIFIFPQLVALPSCGKIESLFVILDSTVQSKIVPLSYATPNYAIFAATLF